MRESKRVNGMLRLQFGEAEAPLNGMRIARFEFQIGEPFQGLRQAEFLGSSFSKNATQLLTHRGQFELTEFLWQGHRKHPFGKTE
jgi:hypothetical protein